MRLLVVKAERRINVKMAVIYVDILQHALKNDRNKVKAKKNGY